jgi:hypothetical protein
LEAGHVASKVIVLEVPDAVMAARVGGRRLDPDTGKVYHLEHSQWYFWILERFFDYLGRKNQRKWT